MKRKEDFNNLPEVLEYSSQLFHNKKALHVVNGISYTYGELETLAKSIAMRIFGAGIEKGDKVAIIGENHPHWVASYFGSLKTGAVVVPILTDFSSTEVESILEHSESKIIITSKKQFPKVLPSIPKSAKYIMMLEDLSLHSVEQISALKVDEMEEVKINLSEKEELTFSAPEIRKDDLAVIIYTSGTTGRSKGVMLSHDNIIFDAVKTGSIHEVVEEDVFLSVLPLAHTYEATIGMVIPILNGSSIHYIDRAPTASYLGPVLKEVRPTTMLTVPLIIEKVYRNKIRKSINDSGITRRLVKFGPTRKLIYRAAGKKLMDFFGGRMRFFGVGGAPLAPDVEKFLIEAGFPYAIGYGLTETAPMLAGFGPEAAVYRSVGKVMDGVEIKIDNPDPQTGEGEIIARGRNIMQGYYKSPELTDEVFTEEGFFKTGDLGLFDKKGILYIKGRSKNMILGANGENIYPEEIESVINEQEFVTESLVLQVKGKLVARVHLNVEMIEEKFQHILSNAHDKQQEVSKMAEEFLEEIMVRVNQKMNKNSRLQLIILQTVPFEKTPTLKIKRFLYKD